MRRTTFSSFMTFCCISLKLKNKYHEISCCCFYVAGCLSYYLKCQIKILGACLPLVIFIFSLGSSGLVQLLLMWREHVTAKQARQHYHSSQIFKYVSTPASLSFIFSSVQTVIQKKLWKTVGFELRPSMYRDHWPVDQHPISVNKIHYLV